MQAEEIPQHIPQIALADSRVRREDKMERRAQIIMWAGILTDVPYDFAVQAVKQHYAQSQWPITPGDIAGPWQATVRDRDEWMRHIISLGGKDGYDASTRLVALAIALATNPKNGMAWPMQSTLARQLGLSTKTVRRAVKTRSGRA